MSTGGYFMKLSLGWIFDHIDADYTQINVPELVKTFNQKVAEIEYFNVITIDVDHFCLVQVRQVEEFAITVYDAERDYEFVLPVRADAVVNHWYLVYVGAMASASLSRWAEARDFGSMREGLIPSVSYHNTEQSFELWRQEIRSYDVIIEVDNKSITHRPDMWGHRGFAREVAALLGFSMRPLGNKCADVVVNAYGEHAQAGHEVSFGATITSKQVCKRFGLCTVPAVHNQSSPLWLIQQLLLVDSKPINYIVDVTNFVMYDLGQPMHAFDAAYIVGDSLQVRYARAEEKITLLDGQELKLTTHDLIVADEAGPLALAGIMGGLRAAVTLETRTIVFEAACFDATSVRLSSVRHKKRTDASARFEKSLDPLNNITALKRALALLAVDDYSPIVSLGNEVKPTIIEIAHDFIESRLGMSIEPALVIQALTALEFGVLVMGDDKAHPAYEITVPTFRSTKDVLIKEDIVEEVGRSIGYDMLKPCMPLQVCKPHNLKPTLRVRTIKDVCAFGMTMQEVNNYPFFDEELLTRFAWDPFNAVTLANPLSHNRQRLVTSLVPHVLSNIAENQIGSHTLRFFEWNKVWTKIAPKKHEAHEKTSLALVFFDHHAPINFYTAKKEIAHLFDALSLNVLWEQPDIIMQELLMRERPWFEQYQTAVIRCGEHIVGYAGIGSRAFTSRIIDQGYTVIAELDGDFLRMYEARTPQCVTLPKYQQTTIDISMLVPLSVTVADMSNALLYADQRIVKVDLIDFFEKEEWHNRKSITMRLVIRDEHKTLEKEDIDEVYAGALSALKPFEVTIR
jgi:phenylalanyl-tRNA synthetase beta chain